MSPLELRIVRAKLALDKYPKLLADKPHPSPDFAHRGLTARIYWRWMLDHGGKASNTRACKAIEDAVAKLQEPMFSNPK